MKITFSAIGADVGVFDLHLKVKTELTFFVLGAKRLMAS